MTPYLYPTIIGEPDVRSRTSEAGLWSGAGSTRSMDIFSNPPKVHGRVLWANPITISHFLCVPHYYWGVGRPEWVSGTTPTTAPCSPSGWQFYLYVGYRNTVPFTPKVYSMCAWPFALRTSARGSAPITNHT